MPCFSDYAFSPLVRCLSFARPLYLFCDLVLANFFAIFQCFRCLRCFQCLRCFFGFELSNLTIFAEATLLFGFKSVFPVSAKTEPVMNKHKIKLPIIPTLFLICFFSFPKIVFCVSPNEFDLHRFTA